MEVPARDIPTPSSISPEAQAIFGGGVIENFAYPALDDHDAWRTVVAETDALVASILGGDIDDRVILDDVDIDGVPTVRATPTDGPGVGGAYLDIHGGAFVSGAGELSRVMGARTAARFGVEVWAPDYRMPPDHPYPTPLDDCLEAYRGLLDRHDPSEIAVGGGSAGANLAAALVLRARDEGLPLPAACVLLYPEVDLTESGDSFHTMAGIDIMGGGRSFMPANLLYAGGHDLADPYLSPLFGDFTAGFPPTLIASGTRDVFLSNAVRMHRALRAAGISAQLHVLEAAPHGGFIVDTPEEAALNAEIRQFLTEFIAP